MATQAPCIYSCQLSKAQSTPQHTEEPAVHRPKTATAWHPYLCHGSLQPQ
jgi:hypothetical protein